MKFEMNTWEIFENKEIYLYLSIYNVGDSYLPGRKLKNIHYFLKAVANV